MGEARKMIIEYRAKMYESIAPKVIIKMVADHFLFTPSDIIGNKRARKLSDARCIAIYLTYCYTDLYIPNIGMAFGDRDSRIVLALLDKCQKELLQIKEYQTSIALLGNEKVELGFTNCRSPHIFGFY